ncbi:MAG: response regulator [Anaerolineae bacterium]|nr:response regulator [Anaerolineae bacterium]
MNHESKKILIVEDSPVQALSLRHVLESRGLEVLWAGNGQIGLLMASQKHPDVIVMDVEMPKMNGLEACKHLKENPLTCNIPVIILTVRAEVDYVFEGLSLEAIDFIPKDAFSESVLLETLYQLDILSEKSIAK